MSAACLAWGILLPATVSDLVYWYDLEVKQKQDEITGYMTEAIMVHASFSAQWIRDLRSLPGQSTQEPPEVEAATGVQQES